METFESEPRLTSEDQDRWEKTNNCMICKRKFGEKKPNGKDITKALNVIEEAAVIYGENNEIWKGII